MSADNAGSIQSGNIYKHFMYISGNSLNTCASASIALEFTVHARPLSQQIICLQQYGG